MDVDADGLTDILLVAAPMYYSAGWETGKVYVYGVTTQVNAVVSGGVWFVFLSQEPSFQPLPV